MPVYRGVKKKVICIPKVVWNNALADQFQAAVLDGAEEWARGDVMPLADENCPVKDGTMRDSHVVERNGTIITMGYGGSAAPYAERQHEDLTLVHTVGQHKWLENAFNWQLPLLKSNIEERVSKI